MSGMKFEKEIFMKYLIEREASEATKKKYMTDVTTFYSYAAEAEEIDKELLLAYREWKPKKYFRIISDICLQEFFTGLLEICCSLRIFWDTAVSR